jgi:voltage-dependent potassium channel beta subunit
MEYRFLGRSGLRVSVISFGAWITQGNQVEEDLALECMKVAYENGCNFFDNAEVYAAGKAEEVMGRCLKRMNVPRDELVISTKIFWGGNGVNQKGLSRKHLIEGTRASLKRLQLDYVDLLFCHRPDPYTPIEETVRAMNFLIDQGLTFYWGTSEWSAEELADAHGIANRLGLIGPLMEQPQYSMLHRTRFEKEYVRLYKDYGLGTTIWSPLACGLLTGKYTRGQEFSKDTRLGGQQQWLKEQLLSGKGMNGLEEKSLDKIYDIVDGLKPIADKLGVTLAQLALAWCIINPNVSTVITGASKTSQVVENFKALEVSKRLTPEILEEIEKVLNNKPTFPETGRLNGR